MELRLLGEVALFADGGEAELGSAKQRCVLAALAVDAGRAVSAERLIDRVWADDPPLRVRETLSVYVSRLRRVLASAGNAGIARRAGGYVLEIEASAVDLHRFRTLRDRAMSQVTADRRVQELLREALRLWRGEALAGLGGGWAVAERDRLHRERLDAEHELTDVLLRLGHGPDLVSSLATRAAENPLDERVAGQYMVALSRAGRAADALLHYQQVRKYLAEELGTPIPAPRCSGCTRRPSAAPPAGPAPARCRTGYRTSSGVSVNSARSSTRSAVAPPCSCTAWPAWARPPWRSTPATRRPPGSRTASCSSTCTATAPAGRRCRRPRRWPRCWLSWRCRVRGFPTTSTGARRCGERTPRAGGCWSCSTTPPARFSSGRCCRARRARPCWPPAAAG
ncbi:hypothetical protein CF165_27380 [Amycolatopsis vastitatis]|uniref:OmpR/PhoB-type domain-containing protein n=1 Tax=Amycolatopsis vastitatis TaxID=1905142 RepID=A0A229SZ96_9PSEU|nr:hypothetical protein CF165_27380 [Amycolatopsis vastitatis]